jgi:arginyl-tRNA synthetase
MSIDLLKPALAEILSPHWEMESSAIEPMFEVPSDRKKGDLALPCFQLAKVLRKAPPVIAAETLEKIQGDLPSGIGLARADGPYLNFFLDPAKAAVNLLSRIVAEGEGYGSSSIGNGKTMVLDFSSPNIAKPFSIGHLRSTVIGHATSNILSFLGYPCVRINHLGDWGTQFGKLMVAYKEWGSEVDLEGEKPIQALLDLYVRFHKLAEEDPSWDDRGREWFKRLEDGDEEATRLWNWFKSLSLKEFQRIYDRLGVEFDSWSGEAFYNDKMERVIESLRDKGLLVESRGAKIVDLEPYGMNPVLIQRSDDATLYATRDLAAAFYRHETYGFHRNLYFVATQQNEHFQQVFKVLELLGEEWAKDCVHVAFGLISFAEGTMSTRKGKVVFLEDVLNQAVERVEKIMEEKNPDLPDRRGIAEKIGVGAIVFYDLSRKRIKDWVFEWDRILNFDGETGPYVMYTHARFRSILRKARDQGLAPLSNPAELQWEALENDEAKALLHVLESFPAMVMRAGDQFEPSVVTQSIVDIADRANKFYNAHHVLVEDRAAAETRLLLVQSVATVLRTGLSLLGVDAPEEM